jgi:HAD superfamily hydrolase (TIGR01549 family)
VYSPDGLRAILFDLDGTLRHNLPPRGEVFASCATGLGLQVHSEDRLRAARWEHYYFAMSPQVRADRKKFVSDENGFWVNFARRRLIALGASRAQAEALSPQVSQYMRTSYQPQSWIPPEAFEILSSLEDAGYILGVVSNRDNAYENQLAEWGLGNYFSFSLAGGEVNAYKPKAAIFKHALHRAGARASESIYVGDNFYADVVGARNAGLGAVLYDPNGTFPDPGCAVIDSFNQLPALLEGRPAWLGNDM